VATASRTRDEQRKALTPTDKAALELAIEIARKRDRAQRQKQIDTMLKEQPWHEVAEFAAYGCQCDTLHLKPWQPPPCWAEIDDQDNEAGPISGRRAAAELLRRMQALGISRWHPNPIAAIAAAEAEPAA
jgi:hypothetical protein